MQQLLDRLLAVATELAKKGKGERMVISWSMNLLLKPHFDLQAEVVEGLMEGVCKNKQLLSKQFMDNCNCGYPQVSSLGKRWREEAIGLLVDTPGSDEDTKAHDGFMDASESLIPWYNL